MAKYLEFALVTFIWVYVDNWTWVADQCDEWSMGSRCT